MLIVLCGKLHDMSRVTSPHVRSWYCPTRVVQSLRPYLGDASKSGDGGRNSNNNNQLSREAPTVNLSWLTAVRAQCTIGSARQHFLVDGRVIISFFEWQWWQRGGRYILWLEKDTIVRWIADGGGGDLEDSTTLGRGGECVVHATAWQKPFYIMGTYAKSRSDISQTPFYVSSTISLTTVATTEIRKWHQGKIGLSNGTNIASSNCMVRLGVSSVEEVVCPVLAQGGCGGIARLNNEHISTNYDEHN